MHSRPWNPLRQATMLLLVVAGAQARAAVVEEVQRVPVAVHDAYGREVRQEIVVTLWHDDALAGPHPILVLNHGRAVEAQARAAMGRAKYTANARWFARLGFLVAVPTRIGYGETGGPDVEDTGSCNHKVYPPAYLASAQQTVQVFEALKQRSDVVPDQSVVVGQSLGGATSIAVAALNPPGLKLAINFAGGAGGNPKTQPQRPCMPASIEQLFAGYGKTARVPTLWIYTENDMYFGPRYPKQWFDAFRAAGGVGEHVLFGPHGADGHSLFTAAPEAWRPRVLQALKDAGIPLHAPE